MSRNHLSGIIAALLFGIFACRIAQADPSQVNKIRRYYKDHNLDFFGELIAGETDFLEDEKRHAKLELLADDARTKALAQLDALLQHADASMASELLVRRATLLADRARTATYFQNNPIKTSRLKAPRFYLDESIATFKEVERRFPNHPSMDVVLFSIAYNYGELNRNDDAMAYYRKLIARFPSSPLIGDARLAVAEVLFDKRKFGEALSQLREIVASEHPRLKNFALYKMGWAYYNMADLDSAIHSLEKVIEGVNNSGVARAKLELRKEALNDLVLFYSELPQPNAAQDATKYFERVAQTPDAIAAEYASARSRRLQAMVQKGAELPEEEQPDYEMPEHSELLLRLVNAYRDHGRHLDAMTVSEQWILALPRHPRTPVLLRLRAESAERLRRRDLVVAELERLAERLRSDLKPVSRYEDGLPRTTFEPVDPAFARGLAKLGDGGFEYDAPSVELATAVKIEPQKTESGAFYRAQLAKVGFETLRDFTQFVHGEWTKTQNPETARHAVRLYDLALGALLLPWRGAPLEECLELMRHRAELKYALKDWSGAAADYHWLAEHLASPEKRDDALKGEIASREAALKEKPVPIAHGDLKPEHRDLEQAYDFYLAVHWNDAASRALSSTLLAASARLLRDYGKSEAALARMVYYSRHYADQKEALNLAKDALATLESGARWQDLKDYSKLLLDQAAFSKSSLAPELTRSHEYASLKLLEKLEQDHDWEHATKAFAEFARENPKSSFVSQSLMKSANAALQMGDLKLTAERLLEATKAPDPAVRLQAWLGLEPYYRQAFQWEELKLVYAAILKLNPDSKTIESTRKNLAAIAGMEHLGDGEFAQAMSQKQPELESWLQAQEGFEKLTREFAALRFVKSNNNPASNFKKKADLYAKLSQKLDQLESGCPGRFKKPGALWANLVRVELLVEFAQTLETAAAPQALKAGTDSDRKAYQEAILGQAKDLREKAKQILLDSADAALALDSPQNLDERFNRAFAALGLDQRLGRSTVAELWRKRPRRELEARPKEQSRRKVSELGFKILRRGPGTDATRALLLELASEYASSGERGYALSVIHALRSEKADDPVGAKALRLEFELAAAEADGRWAGRQPAADSRDELSPSTRWNLAALWLGFAGAPAGSFSDSEREWFKQSAEALLRPQKQKISSN